MIASQNNNVDAVKMLLHLGASVNKRSFDDSTALHLAATEGNLSVLKILVEVGKADIDAKNKDGMTPLEAAEDKIVRYKEEVIAYHKRRKEEFGLKEFK